MTVLSLYKNVQIISKRFGLTSAGQSALGHGFGKLRVRIETISHELAHMLCLKRTDLTSEKISEIIETLDDDVSDDMECRACAVEILALEMLDFPVSLRLFVPALASENMKIINVLDTFQRIYKYLDYSSIKSTALTFVKLVNSAEKAT